MTLTAPAPGTDGRRPPPPTVTGTTSPGANVVVESLDTTTGAPSAPRTSTAAADGSFSVTVPVGFGDDVLTVSATASGNRTGYAQTTVISDVTERDHGARRHRPGRGDDNGPGTYQYPTASDFQPGAFDLTRFQVISDGTDRVPAGHAGNLAPTFGAAFGAQLLDVYVHDPGAGQTSTAAAYATRNYTIAPADAWSELVEVQGFAAPVWQDASGNSLGTAVHGPTSQSNGTVTIALPEAAVRHAGLGVVDSPSC